MKIKRDEIKLLLLTYLLCIALFTNLTILKDDMDKGAIYMGVIVCGLITATQILIRKFYPHGDKFLITFACILSVIGIAVLYRLDTAIAIRQLMYFAAGIIIFIALVVIIPDIRDFVKYKKVYLIATLIIMPTALLAHQEVYGATNWITIGGFSIQPSEFGKITFAIYLAAALHDYEDKNNIIEDFKQLWQPALVVLYSLGCLVAQKDLGSALIFFGISLTMLYVATGKKKYVVITFVLFVLGSILAYKLFPHVRQRVLIWRDPWKYKDTTGYQIVQGLYSISSGGMFGSGLGQGYPGFMPVNTSDLIFAVICEELGMVFGLGIMIIYFLFFYRGMRASFRIKDRFSQLNAIGLSAMIACQVLVIIGGVFAVIPLTGITLPLISAGGSSIITMFFALAILQKISEEG
ncbi:FtsW/RodA/SpoVE family cell cycle protein [Clostridium beijerinckii]|uniref:Lipid II flippase FtsW n=1 Tax=Clostridium beijerinckii TaxID=1520 RepID=A0A1S8SCN8_CLOBE|nr:FtsW/RodA/SpoVE family cell cycle protein [Clostridium beijerinckii]NRY60706.1 cell division protein FtsW (lipid II flippase) [Clostridium beijerinckii]OOM63360.1 lipid II flippase FtsW [Clostridium beijerinckii]